MNLYKSWNVEFYVYMHVPSAKVRFLIYCMNKMPISMSDLNNYDRQQSKDSILMLYLEEK